MLPIRIGDVTISSIVEREGPWRRPEDMFPAWDPELGRRRLAELPAGMHDPVSGRLNTTFQTIVVRTPRHTVLIDTCTGADKGYAAPMDFDARPWLDNFRTTGLSFEAIDYVFCTHLHIDHCGWNTMLRGGRWVPTFPRAKYVFHKGEYAYWEAMTRAGHTPPGTVWSTNCRPIVEAGQALLVDDTFELDDTFAIIPTPGHSPHHCCVEIRSRGERAVVTGDLMNHAIQLREPSWSTVFCADRLQAERSRRALLGTVADTSTLIVPIHFPSPTAGHVGSDDGGARFTYSYARRTF